MRDPGVLASRSGTGALVNKTALQQGRRHAACLRPVSPLPSRVPPLLFGTSISVAERPRVPVTPCRASSIDRPAGNGILSSPDADTVLGAIFLKLLPGPLYYSISLILPLMVLLSAWGAAHTSAVLSWVQLVVQHLGPLSVLPMTISASRQLLTLLSVALSFCGVYFVFFLAPFMDSVLGHDLRVPSPQEAAATHHSPLYRSILHAYVLLHYFVLATSTHAVCTGHLHPLAVLGVVLSQGFLGTIYFTVAHELLHGSPLDRLLSNVLLACSGYMHFTESHLAHHIKVATPEDPASAGRNESLWAFLPRTVWGNLVDGYGGEARRLKARGIPLLSVKNRMVCWLAGPLLLGIAAFAAYGWAGAGFLTAQALVAIFALETVNYIEHYGLRRRRLPSGRYEPVGPEHSWTAGYMFTNAAAFRLQRHADHHLSAKKPYQTLRDLPDAPQLPAGYPLLMLAAMVPPLWYAIMNPRVDLAAAGQRAGEAAELAGHGSGSTLGSTQGVHQL